MTQKEKEEFCIKLCNKIILSLYKQIYHKKTNNIIHAINRFIEDIESYDIDIYNEDRTSTIEVTRFIYKNRIDLDNTIRKYEMDLYNCDYMGIESDSYGF